MVNKDLGTLISAEMSEIKIKKEKNKKSNTFQQQAAANVGGCAPPFLPSAAPSAQLVTRPSASCKTSMVLVGNTGNTQNMVMISRDDIYDSITVQMGKIKMGKRTDRVKVYPNLMRDIDNMYTIKLSCDATSDLSETIRGASERMDKRTNKLIKENRYILNLVEEYKNKNIDGLMIGRLRYRSKKGFQNTISKKNLPYGLLVLIPQIDHFMCRIHLYNEVYEILLDDELTDKQKNSEYTASGQYTSDATDLEEDDE